MTPLSQAAANADATSSASLTTDDAAPATGTEVMASHSNAEAFTFGDPTEVLDRREILNYLECVPMDKWYDTPISFDGLAKTYRAAVHHTSAINVKRNILVSCFNPHRLMTRSMFARYVLDFLVFGNTYVDRKRAMSGRALSLDVPLAKYVRRGITAGEYWWVHGWKNEQKLGDVFHLMEGDISQELYGLPEYLSALNSVWLNESATLFRRRYYKNGSHAGFILYMTDAAQNDQDVTALREALKQSKGPGNFRNLFMYAPNGKPDGIKLIPVSEVAAKDEFRGIKDTSRDDMLAMHRVPPQLLGVMPNSAGGFGNVVDAAKIFNINEIEPLKNRLMELNDWLGEEVITFNPYALANQESGQGAKP